MHHNKINLLILVGGKSPEHKISLRSGQSVIKAIDKNKYNIYLVGIDMDNNWSFYPWDDFLEDCDDPVNIRLKDTGVAVRLDRVGQSTILVSRQSPNTVATIDVAFPVLHGAYGEDGVMQGLLRYHDLPFVGVDVLASSIGMDKDICKRLWRDAGIPIADYLCVYKNNPYQYTFEEVVERLGHTVFVKPANAGSSVGVHKVTTSDNYTLAINDALQYDKKVLIEEAISGVEVECAVLGNILPQASLVGGIVAHEAFYTYEAKYVQKTGATLSIPYPMSDATQKLIRDTALMAFQAIDGEGLSRVDFFLREDQSIIINEINTLPGFTNISMYPKLWEATGIPYAALIDNLIQLAFDREKIRQDFKI